MKMRTILAFLLIAVLAVGAVGAQDLCFGLSADDCALIAEASAYPAMSFTQTFGITFEATGVGPEPITFNLEGSGPFAVNAEAMMSGDMSSFPVEMDMTMDVSFSGGPDGAGEATIKMIIADGVMYMQDPASGEWMGIDLIAAMSDPELMAQMGVPFDPAMLADPTALLGAGGEMPDLTPFMGLMEIPGFLTYVRDGDVFTFTTDFTTLFSAPEFGPVLTAIAEAAGDPSLESLGQLLPMIVTNATIEVVQKVDASLPAVTGLEFIINATVNGAMLDPNLTEPIVVTSKFWVDLTGINETYEFVAPEGATMMPMGQ